MQLITINYLSLSHYILRKKKRFFPFRRINVRNYIALGCKYAIKLPCRNAYIIIQEASKVGETLIFIFRYRPKFWPSLIGRAFASITGLSSSHMVHFFPNVKRDF